MCLNCCIVGEESTWPFVCCIEEMLCQGEYSAIHGGFPLIDIDYKQSSEKPCRNSIHRDGSQLAKAPYRSNFMFYFKLKDGQTSV